MFEDTLASMKDLAYGVVQPGPPRSTGIPIVRVGDIRNGVVDTTNPMRIDPVNASKFRRSEIVGGELLVTLVGTVGETAVASSIMRGWNVARAVAVARIREDIGARWVAHALKLPAATALISSRLNTTVQATLNLSDLRQVPIVLPPEPERRRISGILDALDDKIASNLRVIALSQDLLRALLARFTSSSSAELQVRDVFEPRSERSNSPDPFLPYVGLEHMDGFKVLVSRHGRAADSKTANKVFRAGDVLFGRIRPYFGNVGAVGFDGVAAQSIEVLKPLRAELRIAGLLEVSSQRVIDIATSRSAGTTMPQVHWRSMEGVHLRVPNDSLLESFNLAADPMLRRLHVAATESDRLAALRDLLLPELMTGRLRIHPEVPS